MSSLMRDGLRDGDRVKGNSACRGWSLWRRRPARAGSGKAQKRPAPKIRSPAPKL